MSCSLTQNHMYVPDLLNTHSMLTHLQSYKSISPMTRAPLGDCAGRGPRDRQNGMENDRDGTWVRCGFGWSFVAAVWAGSQCLVVYFFPPRIYSFFFPLFSFTAHPPKPRQSSISARQHRVNSLVPGCLSLAVSLNLFRNERRLFSRHTQSYSDTICKDHHDDKPGLVSSRPRIQTRGLTCSRRGQQSGKRPIFVCSLPGEDGSSSVFVIAS